VSALRSMPAFFAYSDNVLADVKAGIMVDVEATPAHRSSKVNSTKTMIDHAGRKPGRFAREDLTRDEAADCYRCPNGKELRHQRRNFTSPRSGISKDDTMIYRASQRDCQDCPLKQRCCPSEPARKVRRSIHEPARELARSLCKTPGYAQSRRDRKKVEMLFGHMKRILKLTRLRLRGITGAQDEFIMAATTQNLRRMAMWLSTGPPGHSLSVPA